MCVAYALPNRMGSLSPGQSANPPDGVWSETIRSSPAWSFCSALPSATKSGSISFKRLLT
jgi:hypothetical protein